LINVQGVSRFDLQKLTVTTQLTVTLQLYSHKYVSAFHQRELGSGQLQFKNIKSYQRTIRACDLGWCLGNL